MAFSDFILTNAGETLLEKVMSGTTALKLTSFKIGSGTLNAADIAGLTSLKKEMDSFTFGSVSALPDDTGVHLTVDVDNKAATTSAYQWTESAIYAADPDKGSIIFAASYATDSGETIPVYGGKYPISITEDIVLAIASASSVSITVDGTAWISRSTAQGMIDAATEQINRQTLDLVGHLHRDIARTVFKLRIQSLIDSSDYKCIMVDTIDAASDVKLISGSFGSGAVYI